METTDEVIADNFKIAHFLNLDVEDTWRGVIVTYKGERYKADQLLFHSDWNWLMDVIEKVENLSFKKGRHFYLHVTQSSVQIRVDRMEESTFYLPLGKWGTYGNSDKRTAIYKSCLEFINWYNQQNKTS